MRKLFTKNEPTVLDENIDRIMQKLATEEPTSDEYEVLLSRCAKLNELKRITPPTRVSPDTIVTAAASVLGILIIVAYEHAHVVTSKGLGFIPKP